MCKLFRSDQPTFFQQTKFAVSVQYIVVLIRIIMAKGFVESSGSGIPAKRLKNKFNYMLQLH